MTADQAADLQNLGVLVLAAGKSTRIQSISGGIPKPLLAVQGRSILERNLLWLGSAGIQAVWINLHYRPEEIRREIAEGQQLGLHVSYSLEPEILGTAGAYKKLQAYWQGTTLVVYGDSLVRFNLKAMLTEHRAAQAMATLALFDQNTHPHTAIAGGRVLMDDEHRITAFVETSEGELPQSTLVNAAVYLLEPAVLNLIPDQTFYDFARDLFPKMLADGYDMHGHLIEGYCLGLDTPDSYAKAMTLIESGSISLD